MKPLHQFWHLVKFPFLLQPSQMWLWGFICLCSSYSAYLSCSFEMNDWKRCQPSFFFFYVPFMWQFTTQNMTDIQTAKGTGIYLWTRAIERRMIFWSRLFLYAVVLAVMLLPLLPLLHRPPSSFKMEFHGAADNPAFQNALLADPVIGAHLSDGSGHDILIQIPHGRDILIGLWTLEVLAVALLIFAMTSLRLRGKWATIVTLLTMSLIIGPMILPLCGVDARNICPLFDYGNQFMAYAHHSGLAWLTLLSLSGLIVWNARRTYLRP